MATVVCVNGALKIKISTASNRFVKMQFAIHKIDNEQNNPQTKRSTQGKNARIALEIITKPLHLNLSSRICVHVHVHSPFVL